MDRIRKYIVWTCTEEGYTGQRWMDMELPRRRNTGIAQKRFPDVMKEDMQRVGVKKKGKMETDDQQW